MMNVFSPGRASAAMPLTAGSRDAKNRIGLGHPLHLFRLRRRAMAQGDILLLCACPIFGVHSQLSAEGPAACLLLAVSRR